MIDVVVLGALNHLLGQAGWARQRLSPFAGHCARISAPPWDFRLCVGEDGYFETAPADATSEVEIALPREAPFLLLQGVEQLMRSARIEGGVQFASELAYVLRNLRWDLEEDMSRVVGDVAAHRVAGALDAFVSWQKQAGAKAVDRFASFATLEGKLFARHDEQRSFGDEIAALRTALDRTERRLEVLATRAAAIAHRG